MSKREMELKVSPENLLKDLKVLGIGLRLNAENDLVISGLTAALESARITAGAKELALESVRALKFELIKYLKEKNE